jgi:hypothetical protein
MIRLLAGLLLILSATLAGAADGAGRVVLLQGLVSAAAPGQPPRILASGDPVYEGDLVSVGTRAFAILEFADGGKATLRPGTELAIDRFRHTSTEESAWFRLMKGGLRAITGLIGKRHPEGVRLSTATATIGIRGTDFDARLCTTDCAKENQRLLAEGRQAPPPKGQPIAARLVESEAGSQAGVVRDSARLALVEGSPLYSGDRVETGKGYAVIAFSDGSRMTVHRDSRLVIENYSFAQAQKEDTLVLRLLRGGLRALTGMVGKQHPQAVSYRTATATIGIRGTGVDISCEGPCAGEGGKSPGKNPGRHDGLFVFVWEGAVGVGPGASPLGVGQAAFVGKDGKFRLLGTVPAFFTGDATPRPDRIVIDLKRLFGTTHLDGVPPGLYVMMRDGMTLVGTPPEAIFLNIDETGYAGEGMAPFRLDGPPLFLLFDDIPLPDQADQVMPRLIDLVTGEGIPDKDRDACEIR